MERKSTSSKFFEASSVFFGGGGFPSFALWIPVFGITWFP